MLDELLVYDDNEPRAAPLNMAVDEALLESTTVPTLRFYRWRGPSLSFGYFGSYADVAGQSGEREIVRRWTGGGVVPHGSDLTYSVIIPARHSFFALSSVRIYSDLHQAISVAFKAIGVQATLADSVSPKISENCFANAVRADVISHGRKIAGAAHRRTRAGLLHQGSIQHAPLPDRFRVDFPSALCGRLERRALPQELVGRATTIARMKYGTIQWLTRR